jgi:hypothetical protein
MRCVVNVPSNAMSCFNGVHEVPYYIYIYICAALSVCGLVMPVSRQARDADDNIYYYNSVRLLFCCLLFES